MATRRLLCWRSPTFQQPVMISLKANLLYSLRGNRGFDLLSIHKVKQQQLGSDRSPEPRRGTHAASGRWVPCGSPLMLGTSGPLYSPGRWLWRQQGRRRLSPQQLLHPWKTGLPFFSFRCSEQKRKSKKKNFEEFLRFKNPDLGWVRSCQRGEKSDQISFSLARFGNEKIPLKCMWTPRQLSSN